jgi:hypothetical protein
MADTAICTKKSGRKRFKFADSNGPVLVVSPNGSLVTLGLRPTHRQKWNTFSLGPTQQSVSSKAATGATALTEQLTANGILSKIKLHFSPKNVI